MFLLYATVLHTHIDTHKSIKYKTKICTLKNERAYNMMRCGGGVVIVHWIERARIRRETKHNNNKSTHMCSCLSGDFRTLTQLLHMYIYINV